METLRNYLESMFRRYPETPEAARAKAELWQMMEDKYNELIAEGKKENEAVGIVIAEFGDLEEVADTLGISTMLARVESAANPQEGQTASKTDPRRQPALVFGETPERFTSAAEERRTFADEAARQAFGTGDSAARTTDTASGDTDAWQQTDNAQATGAWQQTETTGERTGAWWTWHNEATADNDYGDAIYRFLTAALSVYWPTVTCLYLCWSFLTFKWWMTWIIWPLAAVLHSVLKRLILGDVTAKNGRTYKNRLIAAVLDSYWPCVVFVYFAVSFLTHAWGITWLIYIIAPFLRSLLKRMAMEEGAVES